MSLDGKTLRGTIAAGQSQGLHLLAAFLPEEGWVLMQVEVEGQENEVTAAPRVLRCLDLRGKVVTGDALLAQRHLSVQIVEAGGEYIWPVKENQPELHRDIAMLFEPEEWVKGFSPALKDFRAAQSVEKGHGRLFPQTVSREGESLVASTQHIDRTRGIHQSRAELAGVQPAGARGGGKPREPAG